MTFAEFPGVSQHTADPRRGDFLAAKTELRTASLKYLCSLIVSISTVTNLDILYSVAIMWTTEVLEEAWLSRSSNTDGEKHLWPAIHDWYVRLHSADLRLPMICAVIVWR